MRAVKVRNENEKTLVDRNSSDAKYSTQEVYP